MKLTVLISDDCTAMRDGFGRCSKLLNGQRGELNPPVPAPSAIERGISALADWIGDMRKRQAALG